jgi:hypothetical protein
VEAIDAGLSGRRPLLQAMSAYEQQRNKAALPTYRFYTTHVAPLTPVRPEMKQLLLALRGNQDEVNRFCGAMVGTVPIQQFFSIQNMVRIMGAGPFLKGMYERLKNGDAVVRPPPHDESR